MTDEVDGVVAALDAGAAVVLPTDTVYGLAARAADHGATARLFELKGRSTNVPIAVLCATVEQALELAADGGDASVRAVAARFWPGPLTLVVRRREGLDLRLGEPASTIGLRVPDHELVQAVAARVGPLATTSANQAGAPTPTSAASAAEALGPGVGLVIDGGQLAGAPSTVLDTTTDPWTVLRAGAGDVSDMLRTAAAAVDGAV